MWYLSFIRNAILVHKNSGLNCIHRMVALRWNKPLETIQYQESFLELERNKMSTIWGEHVERVVRKIRPEVTFLLDTSSTVPTVLLEQIFQMIDNICEYADVNLIEWTHLPEINCRYIKGDFQNGLVKIISRGGSDMEAAIQFLASSSHGRNQCFVITDCYNNIVPRTSTVPFITLMLVAENKEFMEKIPRGFSAIRIEPED